MSRIECLACRYVTREDDKDSDNGEADDSRSNGEELLNIDWDTNAVSCDFDLMSLRTGSGRCCAERQMVAGVVVTSRGNMAVLSAAHRLHVDAEHSADSGLPPIYQQWCEAANQRCLRNLGIPWCNDECARFALSHGDGCCRAVAMPDEEKMQQARAVLHAADGEVLGAQSLPIGSDWPVISLVWPQNRFIAYIRISHASACSTCMGCCP